MDRDNVVSLADESRARALAGRSDDELMLLAAASGQDAFRELVDRHMLDLIRYCAKVVCDVRVGEEIAQETWLQVWARRSRYQPQGKFRLFLFTVARNRCRNHARGARRRSRWSSTIDAPVERSATGDPTQLDALIAAEKNRRIQDALASLSPKFRDALLLRFDQNMSYEEIAAIVGRSESTVRSRVFHGLKKLRQRLTGES